VVTVSVSIDPVVPIAIAYSAIDLPLDPGHLRAEVPDSFLDAFADHKRDPDDPAAKVITNLSRARTVPIVIENTGGLTDGLAVLDLFFAAQAGLRDRLEDLSSKAAGRSITLVLTGGHDGSRPQAAAYDGAVDADGLKTGLLQFEDLEDIAIVAGPGSTFRYEEEGGYGPQAQMIVRHLINHAQKMRYCIAVLDSGDNQTIGQVRAMRAQLDSTYAALYYPWVTVLDPITRNQINLPPSGFVAGIFARNDVERGVYKAPANEVVRLAVGFETLLNKAQQDVLNPEGINCFRFFEGRGMRLWGARTISSDPEWKYVNVRRYFAYLERSIDKGTQWTVFEPNGEQLWANVRRTIEDFLLNEWQRGALLGDKPERAFFVRCDRSTMTQSDLDNGRLICLIGVAPVKPAEFVIFRIGQWTADRKV
jgi:phage tail sheath protein FI